ncbi:MAG: glycosyltransferase family 2 protein [Chloroflexi bacterium]|nr:MAG: glycosyltransferase family 2 protein [Chloroflexota bacterium]
MNGTDEGPAVSVIVPTYHRPDMLREAVASVLSQQLEGGSPEVVIAVSDAGAASDIAAAQELAAADARVRVVVARMPGPGAARNAGMAAARGDLFAFIDDDCVAEPGWLRAGVVALSEADLVQGHTSPMAPPANWYHTVYVDRLSLLWEACNLFVRREMVERAGGFDESWNPTGRAGGHWGEDTEWGLRLTHHGARVAFREDARVRHAVMPRTFAGYLAYQSRLRYFPMLLRRSPELRQRFYRGYFISRRHAVLTGSVGMLGVAGAARVMGSRRVAAAAATAAALALLPGTDVLRAAVQTSSQIVHRAAHEAVELGALVYGSVRWRRILL